MERRPFQKAEQTDLIAREIETRSENETLLSSLEGFQNLSQEQQRYLRATLYVQQRAERGTDSVSSAYVQTAPDHIKSYGNERYINTPSTSESNPRMSENPYAESQTFIMREFCHRAVKQLESCASSEVSDVSNEWLDIGEVTKERDLDSLIAIASEQHSFPIVLEARYKAGPPPGRILHTTLVLGKDPQGSGFIAWEKSGLSMPFQLARMEDIYSYYKYEGATIWRARSLRT